MNHDGNPDILLAPADQLNSLVLLQGSSNGAFTPRVISTLALAPASMQLVDVNRDGYADLIEATNADFVSSGPIDNGTLAVYLNDGHGDFNTSPSFSFHIGLVTTGLFLADFNGDGRPDIAVSSTASDTAGGIQILLNTGNGSFSTGQAFAPAQYTKALTSGDFNGDSKRDLVVQGTAGIQILLGKGDGNFSPGKTVSSNTASAFADSGDLNHDGHLDFAVAQGNSVSVWLGKGDGSFTQAPSLSNPQPARSGNGMTQPVSLLIQDFNRDGDLDIAIANDGNGGPAEIFSGKGNGTFSYSRIYNGVAGPYGIAAADVNHDGNLDIIGEGTHLLIGTPSGYFKGAETAYTPIPQSMVSADFNGDGIPDVAVVNQSLCATCQGSVTVFGGTGKGYFSTSKTYPIILTHGVISAGDVNGDGHMDLVVTRSNRPEAEAPPKISGDTVVLLGKGDGSFAPAKTYTLLGQAAVGVVTNAAYLLDVNHDKRLDLVGDWGVALGNGNGTFKNPVALPSGILNISSILEGDLNKDGNVDLVLLGDASGPNGFGGFFFTLLGNGKGSFVLSHSQPLSTAIGGMILTDMNRDGKLDLVYTSSDQGQPSNATPSQVVVQLGRGDGTFGSGTSTDTLRFGSNLVAADFNRDGHTDIAMLVGGSGNVSGEVTLLLGHGDGTLSATEPRYLNGYNSFSNTAGTDGQSALTLDMNGDGAPDILDLGPLGIERVLNTGKRN
ncbi:MAG: FG-GAP repeat domain-containing protein [Acidobacteriaceae bacterium]